MAFQTVFRRYELKYLLTTAQKAAVLAGMSPYAVPDSYGRSTVRNLYFDTPDYRLIRHSIEKPVYKEKLRLRSYTQAVADTPVFVELKKKYKGVVYKRRLVLPEETAMAWLTGTSSPPKATQIAAEVAYFLNFYPDLRPAVYLSYEREAYYVKERPDFRITFDEHILARREALSLQAPSYGTPVLPEDRVLMEIKCAGGMPLWLTALLTEQKLYKTSFSKYGTVYRDFILPQEAIFYDGNDIRRTV